MFTDCLEDYIWLAGFTNGEGCFSIAKVKRKGLARYTYQAQLFWTSTDISLIEHMHDWLGGSITYNKPATLRCKSSAALSLYQRIAEAVIYKMYPYLKLKQDRADIFLIYMTMVRKKGADSYRGRTELDWEELELVYEKMKFLNRRGV